MPGFDGKYTDPRLDPTVRTINYVHVVLYIVVLCVSVIFALIVGAYLGRKSLQGKPAQEIKSSQPYQSATVITEKTPQSVEPQTAPPETTSATKQDANSSNNANSSGESTSTTSPSVENTSEEKVKRTESSYQVNISEHSATSVDSSSPDDTASPSPATNPTPPPKVELVPLTPEAEILNPKVGNTQQSSSPSTSPTQTFALPQRKPKTYAVQLSVLTGTDAKSRAENLLRNAIQKYPQYQFTMERVGNSYKILAINFPNERSAREAVRFLSQEIDFKGAFLIKP